MQADFEKQKLRPFLSIRWKLFFAISCLIGLIHLAFSVGFLKYQQASYRENIQHIKGEQSDSLDALFNTASVDLEKVIMALAQPHSHESELNAGSLLREIDSHFVKMSFNNIADSVDLLGPDQQLIRHWGTESNLDSEFLKGYLLDGKPASGFNCQITCSLFTVSPVIVEQQTIAIIVVQKNLQSLLQRFGQEHELVIGMFDQFPNVANFDAWEQQLYNFTQTNLNIPILVRLSENENLLTVDKEYQVSAFDNEYLISFNDSVVGNQQRVRWVFINDISLHSILHISSIKSIGFFGLISLAISLILLYFITNLISHQLPSILAMSQATGLEDELVGNLRKTGDRKILDDELQQYDRHLAKISHKMDLLRKTESDNALKLQSMVHELNQTKNFMDRLLNDEQTVILVQKLGGEIIALNQAGCSLFEIEDFNGLTYSEIFCSDLLEEDGLAALNYLYLGGETLVKAEAQWKNSRGDIHFLLWVHALLSVPGTIDPVILSICVDITEQRKAEERLEWLVFNDPSLINYNKQVFLEYLPFAISRSLEKHKILALLYCEITGIPSDINTQNTDLNDKIFKSLSVRMSGCLRQYDMLSQLSDDHFVIILEGLSDISDAEIVTDKIIFSYNHSVEIESEEYFLDVIIGASYAPDHTENVPELLRNAEMAMFQAKRKNISFYSAVIAEQ
ncbi:MAG: hypothetical protein OFPII_35590 [Osedax symbiont Rs1]|nr:MAG: hypothetical protein OFPII_35590 [Osedax symbiont Rs1]